MHSLEEAFLDSGPNRSGCCRGSCTDSRRANCSKLKFPSCPLLCHFTHRTYTPPAQSKRNTRANRGKRCHFIVIPYFHLSDHRMDVSFALSAGTPLVKIPPHREHIKFSLSRFMMCERLPLHSELLSLKRWKDGCENVQKSCQTEKYSFWYFMWKRFSMTGSCDIFVLLMRGDGGC